MKPTPQGWPRLSSALFYDDPRAAIEFLARAFGFEARIVVEGEGGRIDHSELLFGEAVVMVAGTRQRPGGLHPISPQGVEGRNTQALFLYVDDADAHCERARTAGARVTVEPATTDYGEGYWADRGYQVVDPEGHVWWFAERVRG